MIIKRHAMFGQQLMKLLPWVPEGTRRVVIDIPADDVVTVYIEQIAGVDEVTVNSLAGLTGGEVVTISPKAAAAQPARKAPDTSSKTDKLQECRAHAPGPRLDLSNPPSDFTAIANQPK